MVSLRRNKCNKVPWFHDLWQYLNKNHKLLSEVMDLETWILERTGRNLAKRYLEEQNENKTI